MNMKSITAMAAALSLGVVPTLASAAPVNHAAPLSLSSATRAGTHTSAKNHAAGAGIIFAALIVAGIASILIIDGTKNDNSSSN